MIERIGSRIAKGITSLLQVDCRPMNNPAGSRLPPGNRPSGVEVGGHVWRTVRRIRTRWPRTCILFWGDSR